MGENTFWKCHELRTVKLHEGTLVIGDFAFYQCQSLEHIAIPSTVKAIGGGAFFDCKFLTTVKLCEGLEEIGKAALKGCTSPHPPSIIFIGKRSETVLIWWKYNSARKLKSS